MVFHARACESFVTPSETPREERFRKGKESMYLHVLSCRGYPPPSGSVSMPPPGDWGEASRRVFGVATSTLSFFDLPRWGRAPVPLLFGGMRPSAAKSERKLRSALFTRQPGAGCGRRRQPSGNLVAVYFRAPCGARRRDGDPHRAQVRGTPAYTVPLAPAPVVVRGVRGRTRPPPPIAESHAHAGADASESPALPARFALSAAFPLSLAVSRLPSPETRSFLARRRSPTARYT